MCRERVVLCRSNSKHDPSVVPQGPGNAIVNRRCVLSLGGLIALASAPRPADAAPNVIDGQGEVRVLPPTVEEDLTIPQRQILEYNRRTQRQNSAPPEFPSFIREGFDMIVLVPDGYQVRGSCVVETYFL